MIKHLQNANMLHPATFNLKARMRRISGRSKNCMKVFKHIPVEKHPFLPCLLKS